MTNQTATEPPADTDLDPASLPLDERLLAALLDTGLDETDAEAALDAVLPLFAADLRDLAGQVEWKYRSMTFTRDCQSETRLHPSGSFIRAHARMLHPSPARGGRDD